MSKTQVDSDGTDNVAGTEDDNLQLIDNTRAIDAGDNSVNSTVTDLALSTRKVDDTGATDTGSTTAPIIDMGALEKQSNSPVISSQLLLVKHQWVRSRKCLKLF